MEAYEDEEEEVENSTRAPRILSSEVRGQAEGGGGTREGAEARSGLIRGLVGRDRGRGVREAAGAEGLASPNEREREKKVGWVQNVTHTLWLQDALRIRHWREGYQTKAKRDMMRSWILLCVVCACDGF